MSDLDTAHMRTALLLGTRGLGRVAPNPAVGCVLTKDGRVIGRGWTQPGGRPHAETEALARAGGGAAGATAYVTLEPCSHHGRTPPCADALIKAGIARAVIAALDPDERVCGNGVARLEDAGIDVSLGLLADEARALNVGFFLHRTKGRPMVTLKLATTLDGSIAAANGDSKWITGPDARAAAHGLRASHDAILVGIGTALADDPSLTCRLAGLEHESPVPIVLDRQGRLPPTARLHGGPNQSIILNGDDCDPGRALTRLAEQGITRLLVEGGAEISAAFLQAGLVDRLAWFHAGAVMGGDGRSAIAALGLDALSDMSRFTLVEDRVFGNGDRLGLYEARRN